MKLTASLAATYADKPDPGRAGVLLYGPDPMRIALKRQALVAALVGPEGEAEMRFSRFAAEDIRKDKAALLDAIKSVSFFPGPRVVLVEDVTDTIADSVLATLQDWQTDDAQIILTAGQLRPTSKIRKAFESHPNAYAWAIYADPPSRAEITAQVKKVGLTDLDLAAQKAIDALSKTLDPGDFNQFLEKLALYTLDNAGPVTAQDIDACAPNSVEAELDDLLDVVAHAQTDRLAPVLSRITAQGIAPTTICIGAQRHFKQLHRIAAHPGGVGQGIAKLRPPVFGPRKNKLQRQAGHWGKVRLEQALTVLLTTDRQLRSAGQTAPQMPIVERSLIRLAMMGRR
ncbi:MAG: DNA polymerase III subunit delta [Planktomarina sp.]